MVPSSGSRMQHARMLMPRISFVSLPVWLLLAGLAAAPAGAQEQPQQLGQFGEWGAYAGQTAGKKVCFALAQPGSSQTSPPNRPRDPIFFFISTRPGDGIRNEISIIMGYKAKAGAEASAEIGGTRFALQTQSDNAWLKDANEEPRMVEAMRKGADLVVKGVSARGTQTTDRYSLKGLAQALDRVAQECR